MTFRSGLNVKRNKKKTGIHSSILGKLLKKQKRNIPLRRDSKSRKKMKSDTIRMYQDGFAVREIKKATGLPFDMYVYDILHKHKVTLRRAMVRPK